MNEPGGSYETISIRSGPHRPPGPRWRSPDVRGFVPFVRGFLRVASGFLALVVLLQGGLMVLVMSLALAGILCGLIESEGPMMVAMMTVYPVLSAIAMNLSWRYIAWLTATPGRPSVPPPPAKSPTKTPPDLWDRDLDELYDVGSGWGA